jgi:hypothetical protein
MSGVLVKAKNDAVSEVMTKQVLESATENKQILASKGLRALGLHRAADKVDMVLKMKVAYALYQYVSPDKVEKFNALFREETQQEDKRAYRYQQLVFTPLEQYPEVPPAEVLERLAEAQKNDCFDYFEVAHIESVEKLKDPIVLGRIKGCSDRFFISQWNDDVSIEDLLLIDAREPRRK